VLSPTSTVLETLIFAAQLRLPENVPTHIKTQRAETVLSQLGLNDIAHTRVGSIEHRGISGGEMRRVSIGIELVAQPDVLVLDEPTSGLDSVSASRMIKLLKNLTTDPESRTTIIASIHQPSSSLYHSFDQVVLLSQGRQLYFGPGGTRPAEFFAKQGRPCPSGYNVADHLLEIASGGVAGLEQGTNATFSTHLSHSPSSASGSGSSSSNSRDKPSDDLQPVDLVSDTDRRHLLDTPFSEKDSSLGNPSYPPPQLAKHNGEARALDLAVLGEGKSQNRGWMEGARSHCATTFLTQIEILSGREWKNLKRYVHIYPSTRWNSLR